VQQKLVAIILLLPLAQPALAQGSGTGAGDPLSYAQALLARLTPESVDSAIPLFRAATARQPAAAYAGLAEAYAQQFAWRRGERALGENAIDFAAEALRMDSLLPQAYFARGLAHAVAGRPRQASEALLRVLALDPEHPRALTWAVGQLWRAGYPDIAYRWSEVATTRFPESTTVLLNLSAAAALLIEPARAESLLVHALEIDSSFTAAYGELALLASERGDPHRAVRLMEAAVAADTGATLQLTGLAHALLEAGEAARAGDILQRVLVAQPGARGPGGRTALALYGWALHELGQTDSARAVLERAAERSLARQRAGETTYQMYRERAGIHALLGDHQAALTAAQRAFTQGWRLYGAWDLRDGMLRPLRGDPAFEGLLARMRAEATRQRARLGWPGP
jgi:tetratricopeptide (TPR) repeat protein